MPIIRMWCRFPSAFKSAEKRIINEYRNSHRFDWTPGTGTRKTCRVNEITMEAEANNPHQDLTTLEAARMLGVSKLHVIDLLEAGEIDYHMVGADLMFDAAEIESYKFDREHRDTESLVSA